MDVDRDTPRARVERACTRWGRDVVIARCLAALRGIDPPAELILALGGAHGRKVLDERPREDQEYWVRVWAARGLLWAGVSSDLDGLRVGLADVHWRVREMCCKVVARHAVGELLAEVDHLQNDPVARVGASAARAVQRIADAEA